MPEINPKNFLLIRPDAIGDCLLIIPAIALLKKRFPSARITVLARPYTREIFANDPDIDEVINDPASVEFIKKQDFDCSIHFYNELPYAMLAKRAGIKYRLGDGSKPLLRPFYNLQSDCRWSDLTLHEVEHNILLLKPLGIELPNTPPPLQIKAPLLSRYEFKPNEFVVGIHLGTGHGNKAWLPDRYAKVVDHLIEKWKATVVLTGSKSEIPAAQTVLGLCRKPPLDLVDKTTLSELIALISRYNLYIGVDTGPLHVAAALGIPTVAIFPTKFVKPSEWGPWQTRHTIIRKSAKCSQKCLPRDCPFDDCLKGISVEDVIEGIEILKQGGGNHNLAEARLDWFKRSVNVLTNKDEIQRELSLNGFHAVKLETALSVTKLVRQIIKEDINIIHWVGHSRPLALTLAKLFSILWAPLPPLLIYERDRRDYSASALLGFYMGKFKGRKYL